MINLRWLTAWSQTQEFEPEIYRSDSERCRVTGAWPPVVRRYFERLLPADIFHPVHTLCLTLVILLGSAGNSESADFQKGLTASDSGDYTTAE